MKDNITFSKDISNIRHEFGARLRRARLAHQPRMTLKQLGDNRLSEAMLSRLERGDVLPSLESLLFLADRLGLQPGALLDGEPPAVREEDRHLLQGQALLDLHRAEEAFQAFNAAGNTAAARAGRIEALVHLGRLDDADALLAAAPHDTPALQRAAAAVARAHGDVHDAMAHCIHGLHLLAHADPPTASPEMHDLATRRVRAELLACQADMHEQLGNRETALLTYRQSLEAVTGLSRSTTVALSLLQQPPASANTFVPATAAALAAIDAMLRLEVQIRTALGRLHLALGRRRDAMAVLQVACTLAIGRGTLTAELTAALNDAASLLHSQSESASDVVDVLERVALGYAASAQLAEAERAYIQAEQMAVAQDAETRGAALALRCGLMWLNAGDRNRAQPHLHRADALLEASRYHRLDPRAWEH